MSLATPKPVPGVANVTDAHRQLQQLINGGFDLGSDYGIGFRLTQDLQVGDATAVKTELAIDAFRPYGALDGMFTIELTLKWGPAADPNDYCDIITLCVVTEELGLELHQRPSMTPRDQQAQEYTRLAPAITAARTAYPALLGIVSASPQTVVHGRVQPADFLALANEIIRLHRQQLS